MGHCTRRVYGTMSPLAKLIRVWIRAEAHSIRERELLHIVLLTFADHTTPKYGSFSESGRVLSRACPVTVQSVDTCPQTTGKI